MNKEIEMIYDGKAKSLRIQCEERSYTHTNQNWPSEVYFVFVLASNNQKVTLLSN